MKKSLISIVIAMLLFLSGCAPEFSTRSTDSGFFLPAIRVVIINHLHSPIQIFNDRGELLMEIPPRSFKVLEINYCWEDEYILIAKSSSSSIRYYRIWCNSGYYYYPRKEVIEIYY